MATDIKFVCVGTGHNGNRRNSFTERASNHVAWMVRQLNKKKGKPGSPLALPALVRFIHFDWEHDGIRVYEHSFPVRGSTNPRPRRIESRWVDLAAFAPTVGAAAFDPKSFVTKSARVLGPDGLPNRVGISMVDIYRAIRGAPRGTVLDMSIYSHGFIDGPVVENTSDAQRIAPTGEPIRTVSDLDGRGRSDFTPHMGEPDVAANPDALQDFRGGFAPNATLRIFGCHVQDIVDGRPFGEHPRSLIRSTPFEVIREAYTLQRKEHPAVGRMLRRKEKPASVRLDMGREFRIEDSLNNPHPTEPAHLTNFNRDQLKVLHYGIEGVPPPFFPDPQTGPLIFDTPFTEVIKFIARQTKLGYVFKAAEALPNVACFGAVPGSGGDYERTGFQLMLIPGKLWGPVLMFFKDFMGITLDERRYGRFDAAAVAAINDRELNG